VAFDEPPDVSQANLIAFELFKVVQGLEGAEELVDVAHVEAHVIVSHPEDRAEDRLAR
jgi:hypothetical protein